MANGFDLGELIEVKSKFHLEDLQNCPIHSSIEYVQAAARMLKREGFQNDVIRFVIYVKLSKKQDPNSFRGIFFYPTVDSAATSDKKEGIHLITGTKPIQAQKDMTGIVHQEGKQRAKTEKKWSDAEDEDQYELGLSLTISGNTIWVLNRSTMQYCKQKINENAQYSYFYNPVILQEEKDRYADSTKFDPVKKEFTNKKYTDYFYMERSTVNADTRIIMKKIHDVFPSHKVCLDERAVNDRFNEKWQKDRNNRETFAKNVFRTAYIACGFSSEDPDEFWTNREDKEIVRNSIRLLREKNITVDWDSLPD
jgi:hypothetical protein